MLLMACLNFQYMDTKVMGRNTEGPNDSRRSKSGRRHWTRTRQESTSARTLPRDLTTMTFIFVGVFHAEVPLIQLKCCNSNNIERFSRDSWIWC